MQQGRINAPTFIYSLLYPEDGKFIRGRFEGNYETKNYQGVEIDAVIPDKALDKIFSIKEIEPRSSCQGHDEDRTTFLIFRFKDEKIEKGIDVFVECMNKQKDITCGYDFGNEGKLRVGVTTNMYFTNEKKDEFEQWWNELSEKISGCIAKFYGV